MGDSVGVSVSFGKYENDAALCWEKWSTFSPNNKYLEEVGKCSTPGSVAQKKAFFEAHYKKIAAIKAAAAEADLLLDQHHTFQQTKEQDCTVHHGSGEDESMQVGDVLESQPPIANAHKHVSLNDERPPIALDIKLEEAVLVNNESMKLVKQHFQVDLEIEHPSKIPKEKAQNVVRKISANKVEKNSIGMKKKAASLIPETPATRLSKPKPKPTSASSLNKASAPSSSSSKNKNHSHSVSESSHLSMSMSSVNSDSVTSSRRRSLFMEQMGDKDIVKRAFKTFQNRVNQLPSSPKQLPTKQKTSTSMAYQKENERSRKAAERPTWKSVSSGDRSLKGDERRVKAGVALKSNERRKELLKKLEEKSNAREAERSLKSKDGELRQNLNLKAKRLPGVSKSKESMKI